MIRNVDHYFHRQYYEQVAKGGEMSTSIRKPLAFYAQTSWHSPLNSAFFSFEPSQQAMLDLNHLFVVGRWHNVTGCTSFDLCALP